MDSKFPALMLEASILSSKIANGSTYQMICFR